MKNIDLKTVETNFGNMTAYEVLWELIEICGVESVQAATREIDGILLVRSVMNMDVSIDIDFSNEYISLENPSSVTHIDSEFKMAKYLLSQYEKHEKSIPFRDLEAFTKEHSEKVACWRNIISAAKEKNNNQDPK
jgi:hypothetical protein